MKKIFNFILIILSLLSLYLINIKFDNNTVNADESYYREYLSDYTPTYSKVGYGSLKIDKNMSDSEISYIVDGVRTYFKKGVTAHATSTLIYDIGESHNFDYFKCYLGVDASQGGSGLVKFYLYTSSDNTNWNTVIDGEIRSSSNEAISVNIDINNVRYLKFYFDSYNGNGNDHSGIGNPLLYSENALHEADSLIKPVEYYDELFSGLKVDQIYNEHYLELLQRMFISNASYDDLKENFLTGEYETERREMLTWLLNDENALEEFLIGGNPDGSYSNCLSILSDLYHEYKDDLSDTSPLFRPETGSTRNRGNLYRTMMFSIALTHASGGPHMWLDGTNVSDPIERYLVYKNLYLLDGTGQFNNEYLRNEIFENLNVEEMRWVMGGRMYNDEVYWLNAYVRLTTSGTSNEKYPSIYSPHRYLKYGKDWDYTGKGYKIYENFSQYDEKYSLTEYGLNYSDQNHLWMVFEGSHICWGISYTGANFANVFGVPAHYNRQPGHAAFFVYNKDSSGRTIWSIDNNISGWAYTAIHEDVVGYSQDRNLCNWGTIGNGWSTYNNATYLLLSSTALDNYSDYAKSEILLSLEKSKTGDDLVNLYEKVLTIMPYHLDAWEKLVRYYINNKSNDDLLNLASRIANNMWYFPLPMHDLLNLIKTHIESSSDENKNIQIAALNNIETIALKKGSNAKNDESAINLIAQTDACKTEADFLLGEMDDDLATFSFDGDDGGKIVFSSNYTGVRFKYSLDGGETWLPSDNALVTSDSNLKFDIDVNSITSETDILIWLEGWTSTKENNAPDKDLAFKIDISDGVTPVLNTIQPNDNENRFLGNLSNIEVYYNGSWHDLTSDLIFDGNINLRIRTKAYGTTLQSGEIEYSFTDNNTTERSYIDISRLSIYDCSSEETSRNDNKEHVIDGLTNTRWHTRWSGGDSDRYITIKVSEPIYLSGLTYTPDSGNGTTSKFEILVSLDGINYYSVGEYTTYQVSLDTPVYCEYVRFKAINSVGGFCNARLIELFEDKNLDNLMVNGIKINHLPNKLVYGLNDSLNTDGLEVSLTFNNSDNIANIPLYLCEIDSIDTTKENKNLNVKVKYLNYETSFNVEVSLYEAIVNGSYIEKLEEFLSNDNRGFIEGDIVTLLKDLIFSKTYTISSNVTIDGNNHKISRTTNIILFKITGTATLNLENITLDGGITWNGDIHDKLLRGTSPSSTSLTNSLLYLDTKGSINISNSIIENIYSNQTGAAINTDNNYGGAVTISNSIIRNTYSSTYGTAICIKNRSDKVQTPHLVLNDVEIYGCSGNETNKAPTICMDHNSELIINGGTYRNNIGGKDGGFIWASNGKITINSGTFKDNYAKVGTIIYNNGSATVTINGGMFIDNSCETYGKTIYSKSQDVIINNVLSIEEIAFNNTTSKVIINCLLDDKSLLIQTPLRQSGNVIATYDINTTDVSLLLQALDYKDQDSDETNDLIIICDNGSVKLSNSYENLSIKHERTGKITYYPTFEQAYTVSKAGDKINLIKDISLSENIIVNKDIEINLNQYTFLGEKQILAEDGVELIIEGNTMIFNTHKHNYSSVTYTWSSDHTKCTATIYCIDCGEVITEEVDATSVIVISHSCENDEITKYEAVFFNNLFTTQETNEVTKKAHNLEHFNEFDSTIFENGYIEHDHCIDCGINLVDGEIVQDITIKAKTWILIIIGCGILALGSISFVLFKKFIIK